jgi:hypothetical protein
MATGTVTSGPAIRVGLRTRMSTVTRRAMRCGGPERRRFSGRSRDKFFLGTEHNWRGVIVQITPRFSF